MNSIKYPFVTEKAMMLLDENKLQFIVDTRSNKKQIVEDVEKLYGFKVRSVRTMTTMKGTKKQSWHSKSLNRHTRLQPE